MGGGSFVQWKAAADMGAENALGDRIEQPATALLELTPGIGVVVKIWPRNRHGFAGHGVNVPLADEA